MLQNDHDKCSYIAEIFRSIVKSSSGIEKQLKRIEDAEGVLAQQIVKHTDRKCRSVKCKEQRGLNSAIGTLHSNLATLNNAHLAQFPTAIQGITALNKGFAQLSGYNDS